MKPCHRPSLKTNHPPTQNLSTIIEGLEHVTFSDILEVELQHPTNNNVSTIVAGSSQNPGGVSSTQTNRGAPDQSPHGHPRQFKSSMKMQSLSFSKLKIGRMKPPKMKLQMK
jgi:hypothetical protein